MKVLIGLSLQDSLNEQMQLACTMHCYRVTMQDFDANPGFDVL